MSHPRTPRRTLLNAACLAALASTAASASARRNLFDIDKAGAGNNTADRGDLPGGASCEDMSTIIPANTTATTDVGSASVVDFNLNGVAQV